RIDAGGLGQVRDHLVDRVLQLCDLAFGLDGDRPRQVPLRHGCRDFGDGTQLRRQRAGELVHVVREALPRAGDALDLRLDAQLAFGAYLAGHAGDLVREGGELVDHGVDRLLQLEDLALDSDGDLLAQVTGGDCGRHLGDVAHLGREV